MSVTFSEGLLREALGSLRRCGAGARECVCWLTGPIDAPGVVDAVLHPVHDASAGDYQIDPDWITSTWVALAHARRQVRIQVHTHPGRAYHSATDDAFPAVRTEGFLSLVLPRFAVGVTDLSDAHLSVLDAAGGWRDARPDQELVIA